VRRDARVQIDTRYLCAHKNTKPYRAIVDTSAMPHAGFAHPRFSKKRFVPHPTEREASECWDQKSDPVEVQSIDKTRSANVPKIYGAVLLLNLIAAGSLAMFIGPSGMRSFGLFAGFMTGLAFVATALGAQ
jgi:hypothetical protein